MVARNGGNTVPATWETTGGPHVHGLSSQSEGIAIKQYAAQNIEPKRIGSSIAGIFIFCPTSKMSHDGIWRAACKIRFNTPLFRFGHS